MTPTAKADEQICGRCCRRRRSRRASFPQNDEIALFAEVYDNAGGGRTRSTSSRR